MPIDLLVSLGVAVAVLSAGLIAQSAFVLFRRQRDRESRQLEEIAKALQFEEETRKILTLQKVVGSIPAGVSRELLPQLLEQLASRLPASPAGQEPSTAVENLVTGYHEQALGQARAQFWFSIIAATVGFIWILYMGMDINPENLATTSRILPGAVMDAVAFLFFRQASETRQRATELYDRLRKDKQVSESVSLVSSIEDIRVRSAVKAQIALHMSGLQPNPIDLTHFLSMPERSVAPDPDPRD